MYFLCAEVTQRPSSCEIQTLTLVTKRKTPLHTESKRSLKSFVDRIFAGALSAIARVVRVVVFLISLPFDRAYCLRIGTAENLTQCTEHLCVCILAFRFSEAFHYAKEDARVPRGQGIGDVNDKNESVSHILETDRIREFRGQSNRCELCGGPCREKIRLDIPINKAEKRHFHSIS